MGSIYLAVQLTVTDYSQSFIQVTMKFVSIIFPLSAFSCLLIIQLSTREAMAQSWLDCQNIPDGGSCIQHPVRCRYKTKDPAKKFSCQSSKCWKGVCRFGAIYEKKKMENIEDNMDCVENLKECLKNCMEVVSLPVVHVICVNTCYSACP